MNGHKQPCYYCGEPCNSLAGNPGLWPIALCHSDEPGVVKWHHDHCVSNRIDSVQSLQSECDRLKGDISTLKHVLKLEEEKVLQWEKRAKETQADLMRTVEGRDELKKALEMAMNEYDKGVLYQFEVSLPCRSENGSQSGSRRRISARPPCRL